MKLVNRKNTQNKGMEHNNSMGVFTEAQKQLQ
jgi:hypothetical protein